MRIILDTNEYIFGLDTKKGEEAPGRLLNAIRVLIEEVEDFRILVPEIIRKEVQRNIPEDLEGDFYRLIYVSEKIEHHSMLNIPVKLFEKYMNEKGLKEGDALIAAFAEFAQVDYLISENRHVYRDLEVRKFTPVNAQEFLTILEEI
ncbi:MAG: type II toxin-antitoxin system VapC family toxin [Proteobacteria bacterium]|nr:type II toxin-antitoxin system VapC family toxin [Pseudomonadota bacterium]